jgi:hypothetical protein
MKTFFVLDPESGELDKHSYTEDAGYCACCGTEDLWLRVDESVKDVPHYLICGSCGYECLHHALEERQDEYKDRVLKELRKLY